MQLFRETLEGCIKLCDIKQRALKASFSLVLSSLLASAVVAVAACQLHYAFCQGNLHQD